MPGNEPGESKGRALEIDLVAFSRQVDVEIDQLFGSCSALIEADKQAALGKQKDPLRGAPDANPNAFGSDGGHSVDSEMPFDGISDEEQTDLMSIDLDDFEKEVESRMDNLFQGLKTSSTRRAPLVHADMLPESAPLPKDTQTEAPDTAPVLSFLQESLEQESPPAWSRDNGPRADAQADLQKIEAPDLHELEIDSPGPSVEPEPLEFMDDRPVEPPEPQVRVPRPAQPSDTSKLIDALIVAHLTLDWHFTLDNVAMLESALRALEPHCRSIPVALSLAKVIRAALQSIRRQPEAPSRPLMSFITEASSFLSTLLSSETPPGPREMEQFHRLTAQYRSIKSMGTAKEGQAEEIDEREISKIVGSRASAPRSTEAPYASPARSTPQPVPPAPPRVEPISADRDFGLTTQPSKEVPLESIGFVDSSPPGVQRPGPADKSQTEMEGMEIEFLWPSGPERDDRAVLPSTQPDSLEALHHQFVEDDRAAGAGHIETEAAVLEAVGIQHEPALQMESPELMSEAPPPSPSVPPEPEAAELQGIPFEEPIPGQEFPSLEIMTDTSASPPPEPEASGRPDQSWTRDEGMEIEFIFPPEFEGEDGSVSASAEVDLPEVRDQAVVKDSVLIEAALVGENAPVLEAEAKHDDSTLQAQLTEPLPEAPEASDPFRPEPAALKPEPVPPEPEPAPFQETHQQEPTVSPELPPQETSPDTAASMEDTKQGDYISPPVQAPETGDGMDQSELPWLFESLDVAFVGLEWDCTVDSMTTLETAINNIQHHCTEAREADSICKVLGSILRGLRGRDDSPSPALLDFISDALDFLKISLRSGPGLGHWKSEQLSGLIERLRSIQGRPAMTPPEPEPEPGPTSPDESLDPAALEAKQAEEAAQNRLSWLLESLDVAFLTMEWHYTKENITALGEAIAGLEEYGVKRREARSLAKVLCAVLQRLKTQPDSASPSLFNFISDALECLKRLVQAPDGQVVYDARRLKVLIERLKNIRSGGPEEIESRVETDEAAGLPAFRESLGIPAGVSLGEFRTWMESSLSWLNTALQRLDRDVQRLSRLEAVFRERPSLEHIAAYVYGIGSSLAEYIRECHERENEWSRRSRMLSTWEQVTAGPGSAGSASENGIVPGTLGPIVDLSSERSLQPATDKVNVRKEWVCIFEISGRRIAVPALNVLKFQKLSAKTRQKLMGKGCAALADFKPLFRSLNTGLMGHWYNMPKDQLKSCRFYTSAHEALVSALCSPNSSQDTAPEAPAAESVILLVSSKEFYGLIFSDSNRVDLGNETIELKSSDGKAILGVIQSESHSPIPVYDLDSLLEGLSRENA